MRIALPAAFLLALCCSLGGARAAAPAPEVYLVFFPFNGAAITPVGAKVLDKVAADFRRSKSSAIGIRGYSDLVGPDAYNLKLSQARANAVKNYLIARGIKPGALRTEWFGKRNPRIATADGVRNDQNRRSEIVLRR